MASPFSLGEKASCLKLRLRATSHLFSSPGRVTGVFIIPIVYVSINSKSCLFT